MRINVKSLAFSASLLTATQIFSQVVNFSYRVALSRLIGAEGMGLYQLVMPVYYVVLSITAFGLTVAVSRLSASYAAVGNNAAVGRVVRLALWCFFMLLGVAAIFIVPFSDWVSVALLGDARTRLGLLILLPCIFFTGIENICKNYFYGIKEVRPPALAEAVEQLLRVGCVLTLLILLRPSYLELSVGVIITGMVICEIVSAAMLGCFCYRHISKRNRRGRLMSDRALLKEMSGIALPVSVSMMAANLLGTVNTIIIPGRLMVSGMGQSEALAAYGAAFGMTMSLTSLPSVFVIPLSLTLMPRVAHCVAQGDGAGLKKQTRRTLRLAAALVLPACLILAPLAPAITKTVFSNAQAGRFAAVLAVAEIFSCFQYLMNSLLNGMGRQRRGAVHILVTDAVQLAVTWYAVAVPSLRLTGFVGAYIITTALCASLNVWTVTRTAGIPLSLGKWLTGPLFSSLTASGAAYAAFSGLAQLGGVPRVLCAAALGIGVYVLLFKLTEVRE